MSKSLQRSGGVLPSGTEGGLARWGSQYKKCPLGVSIPKSKVMCTLRCQPGLIVKGARKATTAKAACKCDEQGNCKWVKIQRVRCPMKISSYTIQNFNTHLLTTKNSNSNFYHL